MQCGSCGTRIVEGMRVASWWKEDNSNAGYLITYVVICVTAKSPQGSKRIKRRKNTMSGMNRKGCLIKRLYMLTWWLSWMIDVLLRWFLCQILARNRSPFYAIAGLVPAKRTWLCRLNPSLWQLITAYHTSWAGPVSPTPTQCLLALISPEEGCILFGEGI